MKSGVVAFRVEDPMKTGGYGSGGAATAERPALGKLESLVGSKVVSSSGEDIGKLHCLWEDSTHQATFLGVKTGWLGIGSIHVVPAHAAEFSSYSNTIRLPFSEETIKNAPTYSADEELTPDAERAIYDYYGQYGASMPKEQAAPPPVVEGREMKAGTREEARIPLHEEQIKVGKREVEVGGVRLRKIVRTETIQQPVELKREELVVEKVPASEMKPGETAFEGEDIYIPLRSEEPVVEKEIRATEEVRVRKEAAREQRTVSGTVRKEEVATEKKGKVDERSERHNR